MVVLSLLPGNERFRAFSLGTVRSCTLNPWDTYDVDEDPGEIVVIEIVDDVPQILYILGFVPVSGRGKERSRSHLLTVDHTDVDQDRVAHVYLANFESEVLGLVGIDRFTLVPERRWPVGRHAEYHGRHAEKGLGVGGNSDTRLIVLLVLLPRSNT